MTRIIAGEFRRRKLRTNPGLVTRPITDRMKETLFERLGDLEGQRVADVFAGTGSLGLECLSRGASSVVFYENDRRAFDLLRTNVDMVGVAEMAMCWRVDVRRTSFRPKGVDECRVPYSLVFFDPPYKLADELAESKPLGAAMVRLARPSVTEDEVTLVLRTPNEMPLVMPDCWEEERQLVIASSRISLCRKRPTASE